MHHAVLHPIRSNYCLNLVALSLLFWIFLCKYVKFDYRIYLNFSDCEVNIAGEELQKKNNLRDLMYLALKV